MGVSRKSVLLLLVTIALLIQGIGKPGNRLVNGFIVGDGHKRVGRVDCECARLIHDHCSSLESQQVVDCRQGFGGND